jgi:peptide-methionine (R)-S-oxide reductase
MNDDLQRPKIVKSDADWRAILTPEQYAVARGHGTERAFTGPHWDYHGKGRFDCVCCGTPLFSADTKFDSGTGWPSFFAPLSTDGVVAHEDNSHNMQRVEVRCATCDAHLGHVFPDGPKPTGLRYCMNGYALTLSQDPSQQA